MFHLLSTGYQGQCFMRFVTGSVHYAASQCIHTYFQDCELSPPLSTISGTCGGGGLSHSGASRGPGNSPPPSQTGAILHCSIRRWTQTWDARIVATSGRPTWWRRRGWATCRRAVMWSAVVASRPEWRRYSETEQEPVPTHHPSPTPMSRDHVVWLKSGLC